jgi:predicted HAD superfamily Cof-like phosphohydrolase
MSAYTDVVAWHRAAGVPVADRPTPLPPDRLALRLTLLAEEYRELVEALEAGDVAGAAKEAADLITVVLGTDAEQGIDSDAVWAAVHASNVAKLGPNGEVRRRADGKILKPDGWTPPDIAAVLAAPKPGIRPVTYWEAWCAGDGNGEHQLMFGDFTAYGQHEGVESDLAREDALICADGRVYCVNHIPADVCPDSADNRHEHEPDDEGTSCTNCGAEAPERVA